MSYAPHIFRDAGIGDDASAYATVGLGATKIVSTLLALLYLDEIGRRPLLLAGALGCLVSMACLAVAFVDPDQTNAPLAIFGCVLYVATWSPSYGATTLLLCSEMFPTKLRGQSMALGTNIMWVSNLVVSLTFLSMATTLGSMETFASYAAVCAFGLCFVYVAVPETKAKEIDEIHAEVHGMKVCAACCVPKKAGRRRGGKSAGQPELLYTAPEAQLV
jgi:MFS family permease